MRVTLSFDLPKERRFVAVTDPVPAGFEPVESWFATTARDVAKDRGARTSGDVELGRLCGAAARSITSSATTTASLLFATRLSEGHHEFSYVVRATTAGTFQTAPARVEEMYEPEVFGRTATQTDRGEAMKRRRVAWCAGGWLRRLSPRLGRHR